MCNKNLNHTKLMGTPLGQCNWVWGGGGGDEEQLHEFNQTMFFRKYI